MFGKPAWLANVHLTTWSPLLGSEGDDDDQRAGILRLRKSQNQYRALFLQRVRNPPSTPRRERHQYSTECVLPLFPLLAGCQHSLRRRGNRKGHVVAEFDLSQKDIEGIAGLHPKAGEYLFCPLQAI